MRNLFLKSNGSAAVADNYAVPTKRNNGPTITSSSRVQEDYKRNPNNYRWSSNSSYDNTYSAEPMSRNAKKAFFAAQSKYGNSWVNALVVKNSANENDIERLNGYYSKVLALIKELFGDLDDNTVEEFIENLDAMNELNHSLMKGKINQASFYSGSSNLFEDWSLNTEIEEAELIKHYPHFKELYLESKVRDKRSKNNVQKTLKNLIRAERKGKANLLRRNANTLRKWHTTPDVGENRAPGAELLALAAKHGNNKGFLSTYNGVLKREGKKTNKYVYGTGSQLREND